MSLATPVSSDDHAQGDPAAAVTLVEYGDYQCPACAQAHPLVREIQRRYGRDLRLVFRNFPLHEVHPLAQPAAEVAEAAASVDAFWPMHDWLYDNQERWVAAGTVGLERGLRDLALDEDTMVQAVQNPEVGARIRHDFMGGVRSGVNGTPCFFVNGRRHEGDFSTLAEAIELAIERSRAG
jgi:protein-disulfide isomerase